MGLYHIVVGSVAEGLVENHNGEHGQLNSSLFLIFKSRLAYILAFERKDNLTF